MLRVEVAYVGPEGQFLVPLELADGATAGDAICASNLAPRIVAVTIGDDSVGIWSKPCTLATPLRDGDRVEIYRPLRADPKEIRRLRAKAQLHKKGDGGR
jgi:uncharacterized protein